MNFALSISNTNDVSKMVKTITIKNETHTRLMRLGVKGQTFDDIIQQLLTEPKIMSKIDEALSVAIEKAEESKKSAKISLAHEAADIAISTLKAIKVRIEQRSR